MTKRMLIDATHPEETRVVVADDTQLLDFDIEIAAKRPLKGNIYLAKVTRVEPSLQAAFVDYGGNRHGFLPFSEIHPDYYQIPQADRQLLEELERQLEEKAAENDNGEEAEDGVVTTDAEEEMRAVVDEIARRRARILRSYKIQEVIKRRQILLVQVAKEERGSKGAALTTYLSLAGRYCVLMPNTPRGGGISRKITNPQDRRRLKKIAQELAVPKGMGLIIRTAGQERSKAEIRRDYEYLLRLWNEIRETTLNSIAPCLIYEEGDLVKRALRDLYTRDIAEVLVEGEEAYRRARRVMQLMIPSRARQVKLYKEEIPLFVRFGVEDQLDRMMSPVVDLPSGGSIVIHTTEALTAIDVNSGKATRERHIDETALKTNLEAAEEIARQLRLRDLAGLVVIDFIDMGDSRHQRQVERRLREALKADRARIQMGRISSFGLLELSRQRLRPSLMELSTRLCPTCSGQGLVRSTEGVALQALRRIQEEGIKNEAAALRLVVPMEVALYLFNHKRAALSALEQRYGLRVEVAVDEQLTPNSLRIEVVERRERPEAAEAVEAGEAGAEEEQREAAKRRRRRRRKRRGGADAPAADAEAPARPEAAPAPAEEDAASDQLQADTGSGEARSETGGESRRRRRRRRRTRPAAATAAGPQEGAQPATESDPGTEPARGNGSEGAGEAVVPASNGAEGVPPGGDGEPDAAAIAAPDEAPSPPAAPELAASAAAEPPTPDAAPPPEGGGAADRPAAEAEAPGAEADSGADREVLSRIEQASAEEQREADRPRRSGWWARWLR